MAIGAMKSQVGRLGHYDELAKVLGLNHAEQKIKNGLLGTPCPM